MLFTCTSAVVMEDKPFPIYMPLMMIMIAVVPDLLLFHHLKVSS